MKALGQPYCEVCGGLFAYTPSQNDPTVFIVQHVPNLNCPNDNKTYSISLSSASLPEILPVTGPSPS
jgi:hypothetical protein